METQSHFLVVFNVSFKFTDACSHLSLVIMKQLFPALNTWHTLTVHRATDTGSLCFAREHVRRSGCMSHGPSQKCVYLWQSAADRQQVRACEPRRLVESRLRNQLCEMLQRLLFVCSGPHSSVSQRQSNAVFWPRSCTLGYSAVKAFNLSCAAA